MRTIRVFVRRTHMTPLDDYVFIGEPPLMRPETDEVHVSCVFTWDMPMALRLVEAWHQYYPVVRLGGMRCEDGAFEPGKYIKRGATFTSRGCNNQCPWCMVPEREGKLREIEIKAGNLIQDNNVLQCSESHLARVFEMLRGQKAVQFTGGLDARLLTDAIAEDMRGLRIQQLFFAADTKESLKHLEKAVAKLALPRDRVRCYVLLAFNGEAISDATERLEAVWGIGAMPFAQLYQPPERYIRYSKEWRDLARTWSRPAATKAVMRFKSEPRRV